jgi:glucose/arabinose dehydrogenase
MSLFHVRPLERRVLLAVNPTGFVQTTFASNIARPAAMEFAPDGRLFVAQQGGALRVIKDGLLLPDPFVTLPVDSVGERGLLGVAFDPNFASNNYVYLYWTATSPTLHNRVSRFTASGDVAVAGSQVDILDLPNLSGATNHNGGAIHFGADGKLYVAVGDNANSSNSQSMSTRLGKMLRINPDGSIPTDNPFHGTAAGDNRAIWATGLRNPFTFAVQPGTGRIFINDVGQVTYEEINDGRAGANYGWPTTEGPTNDPRFDEPLHFYGRADGSCSIAGGAFYNPAAAQFPASYGGDYFFADYCGGYVKVLDVANGNVSTFATDIDQLVDLKVGPDGSLYSLSRASGGRVHKFTYAPSGAPAITTQPAPETVAAGQPATFSVTASGTPPLSYQWQRNGTNIPGATSASYTLPAVQASDSGAQFAVVVTNAGGSVTSSPATLTVTSGLAPAAEITSPGFGARYRAGDTINFAGSATDPEDGTLPASAYTWEVVFHHADHTHPFVAPFSDATGGSFVIPTAGETAADVFYRIHLTVTDSTGLTRQVTRDVLPRTSRVSLAANVPGAELLLDGQPMRAPATFTGVAGMPRSVEALATLTVGGVTYDFVSWSDGGAVAHDVTVPDGDTTYTAAYRVSSPVAGNGADLAAAVVRAPSALAVGGTRGRADVRVTNAGTARVSGPVTVTLFLSADAALDAPDAAAVSKTMRLRLAPGASRVLRMRFIHPPAGDGDYLLLAQVDSADAVEEADESNNVAASAAPFPLQAPFINLSGSLAPEGVTLVRGRRSAVPLTLSNGGNVPARGRLRYSLLASPDADAGAGLPLRTFARATRLAAGGSRTSRLRFVTPGELPPGTWFLAVVVDADNARQERDEADNLVVSQAAIQVT